PFQDPGEKDVARAHQLLKEARRQRNEAARTAATSVRAALEHAPAEPPPLSRLVSNFVDHQAGTSLELTHVVGGAVKGTAGLLTFARGMTFYDPYNLTHPAEYYQNVNMTLAGLANTAAHPDRALKDAWETAKKDPSEFMGRLAPEALGTKGTGVGRGAVRGGIRGAVDDALASESRNARRSVVGEPEATGRHASDKVCLRDPVDVATGRMVLPQTDIFLAGSLPLVFTRSFESSYRAGRWFGPHWSSTADQRLEVDSEGVVFVDDVGMLLAYPHPAPGVSVLPTHGPQWPLNREDGGYTITDPATRQRWHFIDQSDELSLLKQIDDRNGNWITFDYDADGTPTDIVHSGGYHLRMAVTDGRVTALYLVGASSDGTDQEILRYGYTDGHLTNVTKSSGRPTLFGCDEHGRITSWTDTNGEHFEYVYDDRDRCTFQSGSAGHQRSTFSYDSIDPATGHRITSVTDSFGYTSHYLIDDRMHVAAEVDELGGTTRYQRDHRNRVLSQTDAHGRIVSYAYDTAGHLTRVTRPDGRASKAEYDARGLATKVINPDGSVIRQTYDEVGNRTSVTDSKGRTSHFRYDEAGRVTSVTHPTGHSTAIHCDRAGLPIQITDVRGGVTRYKRDAFGRVIAVVDPTGGVTELGWTQEGRLTRRTTPDGATESWTYDGEGNCTSHTDSMGNVSRFEYTHFDLLAARVGPDGSRYEFTYDTELRLTTVTNPQGLTWKYSYDPAGRLVEETDFDGRTLTYAYDAVGLLVSRTNGLGQVVSFERNELGQIIRKDAAGRLTTYAYDMTDQLAHAHDRDSTLTVIRDRFGLVRSEKVDGRELKYGYDELARRTSRTTPTGAVTSWSFDSSGQPAHMVMSGRPVEFTYDVMGRELTRRFGHGVTQQRTFDAMGRLTEQSVTDAGGHALQNRAYIYRDDGNLVGVDDVLIGPRRFDLDASGRVMSVSAANWTEKYAYDEAGNQTSASWPTDHPGREAVGTRTYAGTRIARAGNVRYVHDALGRMILRQKTRLSRKADTWRYEWDVEDRLMSVTTPDGTHWRYTYDPLGRRTAKLRMAEDGQTVAERIEFTWDGTTLCEQTTTSPSLPNPVTVTWDYQGRHPVAQTERIRTADAPQHEIDSRFFSIVTDLVGSPTELVDEQGDIAWRTRATLWGSTTWAADSSAYTPLRFPGQYFDPESGLHYNYFRHYDPETARYLTPDPLGLAPAPNPAVYVRNPHTWSDPLGLAPEECKDTVSGYRKQTNHPMSQRIHVDENGNVTITGKGALYVNLSGEIGHTVRFRGDGGQIVEFQISEEFREKIRNNAIPQQQPEGLGFTKAEWKELKRIYPEISDPTMGEDLYGIPSGMLDEFRAEVSKYPGRIVQDE
uniref:DUF6531 domain-containing protein n=1 Tax=Streptomyces torulosus TaxID=68276 RepID=UPI0006EBCD1C